LLQGSQQHHLQDAARSFQLVAEQFKKACERLDAASENLLKASECLMELTKRMVAREAAAQERAVEMNKNHLGKFKMLGLLSIFGYGTR
jgi:uncharacterized protein (DUF3084 family)